MAAVKSDSLGPPAREFTFLPADSLLPALSLFPKTHARTHTVGVLVSLLVNTTHIISNKKPKRPVSYGEKKKVTGDEIIFCLV